MEDLTVPADCNNGIAYASCSGTVAGSWITSSGLGRAVLWDAAGGSRVLPVSVPVLSAMARGLNADGWVVGMQSTAALQSRYFGTLWFQGNVYKLEQLVEPGLDVRISSASAVNAAGQIVCEGLLEGRPRAMRLDPR